jgi:hypothetical protein
MRKAGPIPEVSSQLSGFIRVSADSFEQARTLIAGNQWFIASCIADASREEVVRRALKMRDGQPASGAHNFSHQFSSIGVCV